MPENETYGGEGPFEDNGKEEVFDLEYAVGNAKAMGAMEIVSLVMLCIQLAAKLGPHVKAIQDVNPSTWRNASTVWSRRFTPWWDMGKTR